ncbi:protein of unknown function [Caballeronia sp. S22]
MFSPRDREFRFASDTVTVVSVIAVIARRIMNIRNRGNSLRDSHS